jgi:3-dehydroquinate dehydratase II
MNILIINGPNLNFLGIREPEIYGSMTYGDLCDEIRSYAFENFINTKFLQTNHEGVIIDELQQAYSIKYDGIIINPGAFAHYSYAIRDALKSVNNIIKVEVHLSDITSREEFRKTSVTAPACDKMIYGKGVQGYLEAIDFIKENAK